MKNQFFTIPNALTLLRGLGIPLFIYLALSKHADSLAVAVLALAGATDYFDGKLARAWNQTSRLGEILDPAIDRLYIAAVLITLYLRHAIPFWVIALLVLRDLFLGVLTIFLVRAGGSPLTVTYAGKAATFNLLYAFPFLLLALGSGWLASLSFVLGWSFAIWGIALYIGTGVHYWITGWRNIAAAHKVSSSGSQGHKGDLHV
ncbi:MAG: CDP-diacylglycerol--glycerol-3-phosphate 3-phosphatidyltransferase [Actinobacteria bacterium]|uniref:Unannotated protein n=1 Tax=freshwater metagenome TaxID=449393 RepID=A0A6J7E075_9ZZZZ|nr:CDP-alcohol phosphatidyltransferase family protein [Actinomycetota bacterium]MSW46747.1 CDP-diacylglycerol--glycerol-3-phosphate 3-phosphatidyltransferase [Actinomycetota bacterium]MSX25434.1 CDP-diacylglycerol--glycerol-3-phosphate 3-phosphatidyltransferase [Actinomycetota bacterium]MSY46741.1 CDP-diacylglycerol--glycerol-3-phosphate 3-phosphatidyltransferase [Actinomycetota bacterium]MTB00255.1 CDP-diacylglycerol--glycerol-3-phosphate 3-phosphatidyltransferase [Actinomycetota bacterium]